jgi:hypothetical protein
MPRHCVAAAASCSYSARALPYRRTAAASSGVLELAVALLEPDMLAVALLELDVPADPRGGRTGVLGRKVSKVRQEVRR